MPSLFLPILSLDRREFGERGTTSIRPRKTDVYVREGAICITGVRRHETLNEEIVAAVGVEASRGRGGVGSSAGFCAFAKGPPQNPGMS
jgi:hypothetical protein